MRRSDFVDREISELMFAILNLHKTFCIPHGGGGAGSWTHRSSQTSRSLFARRSNRWRFALRASRIGALRKREHLGDSLAVHRDDGTGWAYGGDTARDFECQLHREATGKEYYQVLYRGESGLVAHEYLLDLRPFKATAGIEVEDIAKRLIDYGFHAPTISWPVAGTMMVEPTESESIAELDRFCDALIAIHGEIKAIESGEVDRKDNTLKNAPHPAEVVTADQWDHPYSRTQAAYPAPWTRSTNSGQSYRESTASTAIAICFAVVSRVSFLA